MMFDSWPPAETVICDRIVHAEDRSDKAVPAKRNFATIAATIRTAAASTEGRFLEFAGRLEASIETVSKLTDTFGSLLDELNSENLRQASQNLSEVAAQVSGLARAQAGIDRPFVDLTGLIGMIEGRIKRMLGSVKGASVLAINAKIAAASINEAGSDISGFTSEMDQALALERTNLDQFLVEISGIGDFLRASATTRSVLEKGQSAAAVDIPLRLGRGAGAITSRRNDAAATAFAVGQASRRIGSLIADAVMALQIGDITRQRIEHIDYALCVYDEVVASAPNGHGAEHDALTRLFCRLQAAQLTDAVEKFDLEMERMLSSLRDLAADACKILNFGSGAFGASGGRSGTFLGELAEEVGAVDGLLAGFLSAQREADRVALSVSEATTRLAGRIRQVRSLEEDVHVMGLNMTFKSGRLGVAGRPLAIIAQELRQYAKTIAADASCVMADLGHVAKIAEDLSGMARRDAAADVVSVADCMAASVSRLADAGHSLARAWEVLTHGGPSVAALLRGIGDGMDSHQETSRVLRQAAKDLGGAVPAGGYAMAGAAPGCPRLLDLIAHSYTMDSERRIFAELVPRSLQPEQAEAPAEAGGALDDIFF
jgi:hypothetical protein